MSVEVTARLVCRLRRRCSPMSVSLGTFLISAIRLAAASCSRDR